MRAQITRSISRLMKIRGFEACAKSQQSRFQVPEVAAKSCKSGKRGYNAGSRRNGFVKRLHKKIDDPEPPAMKRSNITVTVTQTGETKMMA
ncbi:MAG: hypothetical protein ABI777_06370, partial [Betaproteobacteria bacterium]